MNSMEKQESNKAFLRTYPFAYGGGMMLISATVATYFSIFMTDTFGIPAAAASVIMFIATLWDAINDPMMGMIADRTHNRFGRYRSYYLWVPAVLTFAAFMVFLAPKGLSTPQKIAYITFFYILYGMSYTALTMPTVAAVPANTKNDAERNKVITFGVGLMSLSFSIVSTFTTKFTALTNGSYAPWILLYGAIMIATFLILFKTSKERYLLPVEKRSVKEDLKRIFKHKEILPVILVWCLTSLGYGLMFGSSVYYIMYYVERPDLIATYMGIISVGGLISSFLVPPIAIKIFKSGYRAFQWTQGFTCVAYIILFFFGKNVSILFPVSFIATLFATSSQAFVGMLINDTIDYIQLKEGVSLNGTIAAIKGFAEKCGSTLNSSGVLAMLAVTGYVAGAVGGQPESALMGIRTLRFGIPTITGIIIIICLMFYPVAKHYDEIKKMKDEMKANENA